MNIVLYKFVWLVLIIDVLELNVSDKSFSVARRDELSPMNWLVLIFFSFIGFGSKQTKKRRNSVYFLSNTDFAVVSSTVLIGKEFFFR